MGRRKSDKTYRMDMAKRLAIMSVAREISGNVEIGSSLGGKIWVLSQCP